MTPHIKAQQGEIKPRVYLPGDPLRAKWFAENYLERAKCVSQVRNMLAFTGAIKHGPRKGMPVTVMGGGMGMASNGIYAYELFKFYGVQELIRFGTCGALKPGVALRQILIVNKAHTESNIIEQAFEKKQKVWDSDPNLLFLATAAAKECDLPASTVVVGQMLSTDVFWGPDPDFWKQWAEKNVLAVEMESAMLFATAAHFGRKALTIATVSDLVYNLSEQMTSEEREASLAPMAEIAIRI